MSSIQTAIAALSKNGHEVYAKLCVVDSVNEAKKNCDLSPIDGSAPIYDVPLNAHVAVNGLYHYPKAGSYVLVVFVNKHNAVLCNVSELDKMVLQIGSVQLKIDDNGFVLKKQNESLKALMADLLAAIKAMRFTTNQGPTINLINRVDFELLETRFNNLLK
jgi:hypothetical protein